MSKHLEFGSYGERLTAVFLQKKGYEILAQNWHYRHKEIDIVARKSGELIFVEVKSRTLFSSQVQAPEVAVSKSKQRYLVEAAEAYILQHDLDLEARFDVVLVIAREDDFQIEHIERAFYPAW